MQHQFIMETLRKLGKQGNFLNLKNINKKQLALYLMMKNLQLFHQD